MPVANQPILFHNLEALRRAGLLEATIALSRERPRDHGGRRRRLRVAPDRPLRPLAAAPGVSGALAAARELLANEPVLVEPADALHRQLLHPHIAAFADAHLDAMALRLPGAPYESRWRRSPGPTC